MLLYIQGHILAILIGKSGDQIEIIYTDKDNKKVNTFILDSDDNIMQLHILSRPSIGLWYGCDEINTFILD